MSQIVVPATHNATHPVALRSRSVTTFVLLVFALSVPFLLLGAVANRELFAGIPIAALMFVCPLLAASILVYREHKTAGVTALLKGSLDIQRIQPRIWYVPILLIMPGISLAMYGAQRWLDGPLPDPSFSPLATVALAAVFFVTGLFEEAGWMGYAVDPMQARWTALRAGILLGLIWSVWHLIPLVQAGRAPDWIAWWMVYTVASRVLIVWLYNNTERSVFAAILFHVTMNLAYVLYPVDGSHYDYRIAGLITASLAALVIAIWGPRTLARCRRA